MSFELSAQPIDTSSLMQGLNEHRAGGLVVFEGRVRNHNQGHAVTALEYEAYEALCVTEFALIEQELKERFAIFDVICVHRIGRLAIGDVAVWVGVNSAHRQDAFLACRYAIDELKKRLPIWKKEFYSGQPSTWIMQCHGCSRVDIEEAQYFARQRCLPEIGDKGQALLKQARVLIVGIGGLGCPVAQYLAMAGVGTLGLCDFDTVDISNLHRQPLFTADDIGQLKVDVARRKLLAHTITYPRRFETITEIDFDIIVDCCDDFATKLYMSDWAYRAKKTLIRASVYQWEGQIEVSDAQRGDPCLRCLWPTSEAASCVGNCREAGVIGPVPGMLGVMQALEVIKSIVGMPVLKSGETLMVNLRDFSMQRILRDKNPQCSTCGESPKTNLFNFKRKNSL